MGQWRDAAGRWHVEFVVGGNRVHRRCPPGAGQAQARALEARLRGDLAAQRLTGAEEPTLAAAIAAHLADLKHKRSYSSARYHAYRLEPYTRGLRVSQAPEAAHAMLAALRGQYAPATLNRSLAALKRAASIAFRRGQIPIDVGRRIELLPERNARHEYLSAAEVRALCAADPDIADAVMIAAYTGLRLAELLALTPASVVDGSIRLGSDTKTGEPRSIPVARPIRAQVRRLPITVARRTLQQRFKAAALAIGRPALHWHDLRHTAASLLIAAGVDLYTVGQILGHRSTQTTARYAHLSEESKRRAVARLR